MLTKYDGRSGFVVMHTVAQEVPDDSGKTVSTVKWKFYTDTGGTIQQKKAIDIGKIEVLCSGRKFYTTEGGTRYWQLTVHTAKRKFYAVAGGFIQQKEVLDIGSGQWQKRHRQNRSSVSVVAGGSIQRAQISVLIIVYRASAVDDQYYDDFDNCFRHNEVPPPSPKVVRWV